MSRSPISKLSTGAEVVAIDLKEEEVSEKADTYCREQLT